MNLLSIRDLGREDLLELTAFPLSSDRRPLPPPARVGLGTMALLFEQPSLRTMSSFASAAVRRGLTPIPIATSGNRFRDQTELHDEIQQLSLTSDCVVVRAQDTLRPELLDVCAAPVINAGDGNNEHPTQALIDIAVMRHFGLDGRVVAILGNMRDHRTAHSLALGLAMLGVTVRLVSPTSLAMNDDYAGGAEAVFAETVSQRNEALCDADFIYLLPTMSLTSPDRYLEDVFRLDLSDARQVLKPHAKILHPFPRFGELSKELDYTSFDAYHMQTGLAPYIRERIVQHVSRDYTASGLDLLSTSFASDLPIHATRRAKA